MTDSSVPAPSGDVVAVGETMIYFQTREFGLLRYAQQFDKYIGGTESNTLVSLAKLGHSTGWISRLGADEFGYNIRDFIRGHGVDVSRVRFDDQAPTGIFFVEKNANDETRSFYYRKGSAASRMSFADLDMTYITRHRILHLTGITPVLSDSCRDMIETLVAGVREKGMIISFDPNLRLRMAPIETFREILNPLLKHIDIFLPSDKELMQLMNTRDLEGAIAKAGDAGVNHLVVKLGDRGSLLVKDGVRLQEPAVSFKRVISSMAAGDAFNAGYLAGIIRGFEDAKTLRLANCTGALATLAWGPYESMPEWDTVMAYVEGEGVVER